MGPYKGHADFSAAFVGHLTDQSVQLSGPLYPDGAGSDGAVGIRLSGQHLSVCTDGHCVYHSHFLVLPVVQQPLGLRRYQRTYPNCRRFYCGRSGQVRGHAPVGLADAQKLPSAELYVSHGLRGLQPLGLPLFPGHPAPQPEERSSKAHHADRRW